MTTAPLTEQQLDEIAGRAAGLYEYATVADPEMQAALDDLAGTDVPALIADLRRARGRVAELEVGLNDLAALVSQWYDRAKKAEARVTDLDAVAAFLDEQELAARAFELPIPAWVEAVRAASGVPVAPLAASQPPKVPTEPETATEAPEGREGDSGPDAARIAITRSDLAALLAHHADVLAAQLRTDVGRDAWIAAERLTEHANQLTTEEKPPAAAELLDNIWTFNLEQQAAVEEATR